MNTRIIFFNVGWMEFYEGLRNDTIKGGGKYVSEQGWGHELYNFKVHRNRVHGYVQPKIDRKNKNPSTIKLEKLGAEIEDEYIDGVTVIWTARHPYNHETNIVGWYKNARVYRYEQLSSGIPGHVYKNNQIGYYATASADDVILLSKDARLFVVPRGKKHFMGQSNVWFALDNPNFVAEVKDYISKDGVFSARKGGRKSRGAPKQIDPLKRVEVEKKAVECVTSYYERLGYQISSVEKDNMGWDLNAVRGKSKLKLEVKGLSGSDVLVQLTPNEYKELKADLVYYRICVVSNALVLPKLHLFSYSEENRCWISESKQPLHFQELLSATVYL
jgi:hypothetical protein